MDELSREKQNRKFHAMPPGKTTVDSDTKLR